MSAVTYASYLRLDDRLTLQHEGELVYEHDQMLFIVIHQVYELWFKTTPFEMDDLVKSLNAGEPTRALHTLRRVLTILKTCVSQVDILETMTPLDFLAFRDKLESSSGFQSFQFREVEFLLSYKRRRGLANHEVGIPHKQLLATRCAQPNPRDAFLHFLAQNGHAIPDEVLGRDVSAPVEASPALLAALVPVYRSASLDIGLCERLVDLDEGFQEWRYRHVRIVERTIGAKPGTGGSSGAGYLQGTLFKPFFPDLWAIRTEL